MSIAVKISEEQLVKSLMAGDENAFSTLYDNYSPTLYGVICRIVGSEEIGQDVLQDAFVKIWKNIQNYDRQKGTIFTWMLNVARNTAIDYLRSKHHKGSIQSEEENVRILNNESVEQNFDHIGLRETVKKMKPEHQAIVDLLYYKGYTQEEASKQLDLPLGTLKTRSRAAIQQLRVLLKEN